ncbi:hypothetical protein K488DRAFT_85968 [Vararia minispora EC-137]|uniref:Uncharacterized protein n=1 Tax=Vararia minispora EC-137 TaxID=1314806 RepID=A0ACB8QKM2_9AGAM|nr:hypothetical protein K488DRAFT_85968 [Vararia minispora EC-137]
MYGASTATTTLACVAFVLATPTTSAATIAQGIVSITSAQRVNLLASYLPFFFVPLFMTFDMALRVQTLAAIGFLERQSLSSRVQSAPEETKADIVRDVPSAGDRTVIFAVDVRNVQAAEASAKSTVRRFGGLDFVTGAATGMAMTTPGIIRGTFDFLRLALSHLMKGSDYADYFIAKYAINRFVELIVVEHPAIKASTPHPGAIDIKLSDKVGIKFETPDKTDLLAAVALHLASAKTNWLNGR